MAAPTRTSRLVEQRDNREAASCASFLRSHIERRHVVMSEEGDDIERVAAELLRAAFRRGRMMERARIQTAARRARRG